MPLPFSFLFGERVSSQSQPQPTHNSGRRLVIVSNRLPLRIFKKGESWQSEKTAGGVATALTQLLSKNQGLWFGWSGDFNDDQSSERASIFESWKKDYSCYTVELSRKLVEGYYDGYHNGALWPVFHQFPFLMKFRQENWESYTEANQVFCDAVLKEIRPDDLIWIHDSQLMLLPKMLREAQANLTIGFFLHIPFPAPNIFRILPKASLLLKGVLSSDFIGFHTHTDVQNFRGAVLRTLARSSEINMVPYENRKTWLDVLPVGIDPDAMLTLLRSNSVAKDQYKSLAKSYAKITMIIAVDRLDYIKGIPSRLRSFGRFLDQHPEYREKVVLVQVAAPSRERVEAYQELSRETDSLVGEINGKWTSAKWAPIIYIKRSLPPEELVALYATAQIAMVTSLSDGMNLVAKEYVACHEGKGGILILSEFAGVAEEMPEAFRVNPFDEDEAANAIYQALTLDTKSAQRRAAALYKRIRENSVFQWGDLFLSSLAQIAENRSTDTAFQLQPPLHEIRKAYVLAEQRLFLLDYDGTLTHTTEQPALAAPSNSLKNLITQLCSNPANTVAIVSGRRKEELSNWFGDIENLWLCAEHGAFLRCPQNDWNTLTSISKRDWKPEIKRMLNHFCTRTPYSFIEEKESSIAWHYRLAEPEFGEWVASQLLHNLQRALSTTELCAVHGDKVVEVKFAQIKKSLITESLAIKSFPFILAIGNDIRDEDLFSALPVDSWTIKVGEASSLARFRVPDPEAVNKLLVGFIDLDKSANT